MYIKKESLIEALNIIDGPFRASSLPTWEQLPDIELYMDQVISLLEKYLDINNAAIGSDKKITSSMINNYVKLGTIPPPRKKRYTRLHLAYLIIVCTLKQTLDMATIQKIIPVTANETTFSVVYTSFVENQKKAFTFASENIHQIADAVLTSDEQSHENLNNLLLQFATTANIYKTLTETITRFPEADLPQ